MKNKKQSKTNKQQTKPKQTKTHTPPKQTKQQTQQQRNAGSTHAHYENYISLDIIFYIFIHINSSSN